MLNKDDLIKSVRNREWCYLDAIDADMPEWNEIFLNIPNVSHNEKQWRCDPNLNFQMYRTDRIESAERIRHYINGIFYRNKVTAHIYFGLSDRKGALGLHCDDMDVIYIQAINEADVSIWSAGKDDPDRKCLFEKRFSPREAIYIPAGTYHQIKPFKPRASISIGIEDIEKLNSLDYL